MGPHAHGNAARHGVDDLNAEGTGRQKPQTDPRNHHHNPPCPNCWAPLPPKRHHKEHRPQRPSERSAPTQQAEGRTGDCPGPRNETRHPTACHTGGGVWLGGMSGSRPPLPTSPSRVCHRGGTGAVNSPAGLETGQP